MKRYRVLVADDSAICRAQLRHVLQHGGDIDVVGEAADGSAVLALVERERPDLVLVDLQMPGVDGLATIERVMARRPVPILVVTGKPRSGRKDVVFEAIRRGALDLAEKPSVHDAAACERLRHAVRQLSQIPVVRHVGVAPDGVDAAPRNGANLTAAGKAGASTPVIGVAASAGGPAALVALLKDFSRTFDGCFAIVQHLPPGFVQPFCDFLARRVQLEVREAFEGAPVQPSRAYLAPDGYHLVVRDGGRFGLLDAPAVGGHRPAASVLLSSMADTLGARGIGIVLSGIGRDGVDGLGEMRKRGALTLAQSAESCAVYGMPRAAIETGAALHSGSPAELYRAVVAHVGASGRLR